MERLTDCLEGKFDATFGDDQETRNAEFNLKYAAAPVIDMIEQYNKLVDDA